MLCSLSHHVIANYMLGVMWIIQFCELEHIARLIAPAAASFGASNSESIGCKRASFRALIYISEQKLTFFLTGIIY